MLESPKQRTKLMVMYDHKKNKQKNKLLKALGSSFILLSLFFSLLFPFRSFAEDWPQCPENIEAEGAVLLDANSGTVLYAKNEHNTYFPASITKVLTAIVVLEHVDNLETKISFSSAATKDNLEANSTVIGAVPGDKLSVRDCLYGLLLHSANDCANALAEYVAGSNAAFSDMMNEKAKEIGCTDSHFTNPSGLNNKEHYCSAMDMAKIMQYAIQNPIFLQIDATQAYTHAPISKYPDADAKENTIYAHHKMMRKSFKEYYEGVFAGKTGYTMLAGNTLLTACKRGDTTLICAILNGHNSQYRDTKKLFDFGFSKFISYPVEKNDSRLLALESNFNVDGIPLIKTLHFTIGSSDHVCLPKEVPFQDVASSLSYDLTEEEKAEGKIAKLLYSYDEMNVGTAYIYLEDEESNKETGNLPQTNLKKEESIPKRISVELKKEDKKGESVETPTEKQNNAPIVFDKKAGKIIIQKPIVRLLQILFALCIFTSLIFLLVYFFQRREEFQRARRRKRMLKHTKDLSREQKARRDLLLEKKRREKKLKR